MRKDKTGGPRYKETQSAEADTPLGIHSCPPTGPQATNKRPSGCRASMHVSGTLFLCEILFRTLR